MRILYVVTMLLCLCTNALAGEISEAVTISRVGPEGGRVQSIVVDPSDSNTLYAVPDSVSDIGVFKSTDRGTTWSYSGLISTYVSIIAIGTQSPATVYAAARGNIFKKSRCRSDVESGTRNAS